MKIDIGWIFTAVVFGLLLGELFKDSIQAVMLVVVVVHFIYILYAISTGIY